MIKNNIEKLTLNNSYYRKVISTTPQMQLVLMSIQPQQEIGMEIHKKTSQFIRIEDGNGKAIIGNKTFYLKDGDFVIVPPNTKHNIINTSNNNLLQLYTIYSPPHHKKDTLQKHKNV